VQLLPGDIPSNWLGGRKKRVAYFSEGGGKDGKPNSARSHLRIGGESRTNPQKGSGAARSTSEREGGGEDMAALISGGGREKPPPVAKGLSNSRGGLTVLEREKKA